MEIEWTSSPTRFFEIYGISDTAFGVKEMMGKELCGKISTTSKPNVLRSLY